MKVSRKQLLSLQIPLVSFLLRRINWNKVFLNGNNVLGQFIGLDVRLGSNSTATAKPGGLIATKFESTDRSQQRNLHSSEALKSQL